MLSADPSEPATDADAGSGAPGRHRRALAGAMVVRVVDRRRIVRAGIDAMLRPYWTVVSDRDADHSSTSSGFVLVCGEGAVLEPYVDDERCLGVVRLVSESPALVPRLVPAPSLTLDEACSADALIEAVRRFLPATSTRPAMPERDAGPIETLTTMQYRVLELMAEGLLNKQIAYRCSISEATVKSHASEVFRKLGIKRRSEAAVIFTRSLFARTFGSADRRAHA